MLIKALSVPLGCTDLDEENKKEGAFVKRGVYEIATQTADFFSLRNQESCAP